MKAVVLTYDKQIGLAELVNKTYMTLWPDCPFQFVIPWNGTAAAEKCLQDLRGNITRILCASDIRETMAALLKDTRDDEWLYWCIDDRYPVSLRSQSMADICNRILLDDARGIDAIRLLVWGETLDSCREGMQMGGRLFRYTLTGSAMGFWHHQFVRAKILKAVFLTTVLPCSYTISEANRALQDALSCVRPLNVLVPTKPVATFAEPLTCGKLTANGIAALRAHGCLMPSYDRTGARAVFCDYQRQKALNPLVPKIVTPTDKNATRRWTMRIRNWAVNRWQRAQRDTPRVVICSFGGVGSKCLLKWIFGSTDISRLESCHSHQSHPFTTKERSKEKVIYIFGDPFDALISFFDRRGRLTPQHGFVGKSGPGEKEWVVRHCKNMGGDSRTISPDWDLRTYLEQGRDLLNLEGHFNNWINANTTYPILFLRYETMWEHVEEIRSFLGLPAEQTASFPIKVARHSDWHTQPPDIQERLFAVYGRLRQRIQNEPHVRISVPATGRRAQDVQIATDVDAGSP